MLGDEACEKRAVDPARIVPRRNRQEGARVVVESDRVVEPRRFGRLLAETQHPSGLSWNHQAGPSFNTG